MLCTPRWNLATLLKDYLTLQGFKYTDIAFFDSQYIYRLLGNLEKWTEAIRQQVISTLRNGYFLYLIGDSQSYFIQEELQCAFEFAPNMILPVIIKGIGFNNIPQILNDQNSIDVSKIPSDKEKAKAIVDALIEFDLRNNK